MAESGKNQESGVGLPIGTKIGKYEITERIGAGGQSIVYKGYDALLDRYVAVKQISSHLAEDPKFLERFRKEAQILARLGGEVITIHDLVEDERGLFIVMEYVGGHTLETVISETNGPAETRAALQILWRLAATLHEVHSAGIIHRDLKPGNIIIAEGLRPKITDFGVAASISGQTSMLLGTTKYMAPEMYGGGTVDGRADIYSLGFIMYELLAGRPKFNEIFAEVVRDKHSEALRWMKWHGHDAAVAPLLHKIDPNVPRKLSKIVAKMIAKNPDDRFASMEELGRAIKSAFSPKARAAAAVKSAEDNLALRGRRALRAGAAGGDEDTLRTGIGDEADELELPSGEPPTAPLPKSSLSPRTKLVLAGVIAASFLTIVGIMVYQGRQAQQERVRTAKDVFDEAMHRFKTGKLDDLHSALAGFTELERKRHAGTAQAAKAKVLAPLCRAMIDVQEAEIAQRKGDPAAKNLWKLAKTEQDEATRLNKKLQRQRDDLDKWTRKITARIKGFARERVARRIFVEGIVTAGGLYRSGRLDEAQLALNDLEQGSLTDSQVAEVKLLRRSIAVAKFKARCDKQLAHGEELVKQKNLKSLAAAADVYRAVAALVKGEGGAQLLSPSDRKAYLAVVASRRAEIDSYGKYLKAMQSVADARGRNNKPAELKAYIQALANAPSQKIRDDLNVKITATRADMAYERGMHAMVSRRGNRMAVAKLAFEEAVRLNGHPQAKAELIAMKKSAERSSLIAAGDVLFAAGKYPEALAKFQDAGRLGMDNDLGRRIINSRFQMQFVKAETLRKQKQYDQAELLYQRAEQIKPSEKPRIDAIVSGMRTQKQYGTYLAAGDKALKGEDYSTARDMFRKAKAVLDIQEIQDRLNEVTYQENLSKGNDAMLSRNYRVALAYFNIARMAKDTAEIRNLIARAKQLRGSQSP